MKNNIFTSVKKMYYQVIRSFAFIPALTAIFFLAFSVLMLELDFSDIGKRIKTSVGFIRLKDASTARSVIATVLAGIISLTVFSFSNVMILLNQAASQLSNRVLQALIQNRFQQTVLGFYIGTIVYSLFLLSSIRDIDAGVYVPALSIYVLVLFAIFDIFLFIYFLHYVTQTVKYNTVIKNIYKETLTALKKTTIKETEKEKDFSNLKLHVVVMPVSNYFQGFDEKRLANFAAKHDAYIKFLHPVSSYLLKQSPLLHFYTRQPATDKQLDAVLQMVDLYYDESIATNFYYGFHQLAEVAIKALSPGINDPQTAVLSMHALVDLFFHLTGNNIPAVYKDHRGQNRVFINQRTYNNLFTECFYPIWNYGKNDMYVQQTMLNMLEQLKQASDRRYSPSLENLLHEVQLKINQQTITRSSA